MLVAPLCTRRGERRRCLGSFRWGHGMAALVLKATSVSSAVLWCAADHQKTLALLSQRWSLQRGTSLEFGFAAHEMRMQTSSRIRQGSLAMCERVQC
jgi:hypothetical protein